MFLDCSETVQLWPQEHIMEAVHLLTMKMSEIVHIVVDRVELHPGDQSHVVPGDPHPQPGPTTLRCASFQESI